MPISLNNSNISVQYNTGSNYIIETVKSDVFIRDTSTGISSNLFAEPSVVPSRTPVTTGNHKTLNFAYISPLIYDFTNYNTESTWKAFVATIPNFTYFLDSFPGTNQDPDAIWAGSENIGWVQLILPSGYNNVSVFYGHGIFVSSSYVRLLINGVEKSRAPLNGTITYSQTYIAGDILRIEEGAATMTANIIITLTNPTYTLTFPFLTSVDVNNNSNLILQGNYNVNVGHPTSSLLPAITNTSNMLIPLPLSTTSNISVRYHLLNPVKTTQGAQWTYTSNNPNVYHLGNVGIGTTSPEYTLDVRGTIYSSIGGYTGSTLTTWSITSDRRIKENIVKASYDKCLENVNKIELYNFNFKDNCVNTNDKHQLGFIAQEVREVYPKAVEVNKMILNTNETIDDILTLNTTQIDYTLYGAVKNLIEKIDNIDIGLEILGSNITYNKDLIRNTSNIFSIITSNISITTSNIFIGTSNISITTSNISIITSNIFIRTSNIPIETSNILIESSNIPIDTSNIPIYTSYIPIETSNIPIESSNIPIN